MKLGFDFHGVLDKEPRTFSILTELLVKSGHEVHVITGEEDAPLLREKLKALRIHYTHLFSIASYHKSTGTKMWRDEKNTPWMDKEIWDVTKAWYCNKNKIDLHIDDSVSYGKHFKTPYLLFTKELNNG
jgi:hypothetical protein